MPVYFILWTINVTCCTLFKTVSFIHPNSVVHTKIITVKTEFENIWKEMVMHHFKALLQIRQARLNDRPSARDSKPRLPQHTSMFGIWDFAYLIKIKLVSLRHLGSLHQWTTLQPITRWIGMCDRGKSRNSPVTRSETSVSDLPTVSWKCQLIQQLKRGQISHE